MAERNDCLSFQFEASSGKPRLDEFVASKFPRISLTRIRRLIAEGGVLVDGEKSFKGARLPDGAKVSLTIFAAEKSSATPEPIPLDILYEDEHLIVVDKPSGLLVHPSRQEKSGTLTNGLAFHFWQTHGAPLRPGMIHRLDRHTSGVIVVAKTPRAHRTLSKHFRLRWVKKFYLAPVSGVVARDDGEIIAPIGHQPNVWPRWGVMNDGKEAHTRFRVKRRFAAHTLLELEPLTGRTHQLRIHCNLIGHPILGDPIYAEQVDPLAEKLGLKYQLLHAFRLAFRHPATGVEMEFQAPIPRAMKELIELLD
ncbi:MAG: RluA family pseudouridine synthase [Acidobacteria bacterium]|nr:RluA family pseudouridine synthase [Acidobacteriota bacterium]